MKKFFSYPSSCSRPSVTGHGFSTWLLLATGLVFGLLLLLASGCTSSPSPQPPPSPQPSPSPQSEYDTPFTLQLGQSIQLPASADTLTFSNVLQDARCPSEVECETHGPVVVSLTFQHPDDSPLLLEMNPDPGLAAPGREETTLEVSNYAITLLSVDPYPASPEDLHNVDAYEVTVSVARRSAGP